MNRDDVITDLHCHILPGIDDGSPDLETTRALLEEEKRQGVTQIVFTPHFWSWQKTPKQFEKDRYYAAVKTNSLLDELDISWSAGAEVRMTPEIMDMNLRRFVYVDSHYFLLEWPFDQFPLYGEEVVDKLLDMDVRPIFAHIERYDYFWNDPDALTDYIEAGVVCQTNPGSVIHHHTRRKALEFIKKGYIHVLSSDAHNMDQRPPRLREAYEIVEKELGRRYVEELLKNADGIFHGKDITVRSPGQKLHRFF